MLPQKEVERRRLEQERIELEHEYSEGRANKRLECMKIDPSKWPEEYGSLWDFEQGNAQGWATESLIPGEKTADREEGQFTGGQGGSHGNQ